MKNVLRMMGVLGAGFLSAATAQSVSHDGFPSLYDFVLGTDAATNDSIGKLSGLGIGDYSDLLPLIPPARNTGPAWEIYATEWSEEDERGYEAFVKALGRSGCTSIDDCLRSPANPYRDLEDDELWMGDCTDMVYVVRGYYAWKRGLPFSYEEAITARERSERGTDLRYTKNGNRIVSRFDVTHDPRRGPRNAPSLLRNIFGVVSTAMLRTDPRDEGRAISSFYPTTINRETVRPGVIAYDIYGHVSIVYDVTDDGRILLISSHPDFTVSREPFGANIRRTAPALGSGLKAWRPLELVGATRTNRGTYVGGSLRLRPNSELDDFSLEQFFGTHPDQSGDWEKARFEIGGTSYPYYDYVSASLRKPGVPFDPLAEMANATDALCGAVRSRRSAVNLALYAKINEAPAPEKLPRNIYGTYGNWERYSTPSRDARLKLQALELRQLTKKLIADAEAANPNQAYVSHDLAAALLDVYDRRAKKCRVVYKRSDGSRVRLTLDQVTERLFDMSFDPFHCPEKRWGAKGEELATCPNDPEKMKWYTAQRFLRNAAERSYDLRTDFTADELKDPAIAAPEDGGIGESVAPVVTVLDLLREKAGAHETANTDVPIAIIDASGAVNFIDAK